MRRSPLLNTSVLLFWFALTIQGCTSGPKARPTGADADPTLAEKDPMVGAPAPANEETAYREILALYGRGANDAALLKVQRFEKLFPSSAKRPQIENVKGLLALRKKNDLAAIKYFEKANELGGTPPFQDYVLFNMGTALFQAQMYDQALAKLALVTPEHLNPAVRLKFWLLRAQTAERKKDSLVTARSLIASSPLWMGAGGPATLSAAAGEGSTAKSLEDRLQKALDDIPSAQAQRELYHDSSETPVGDRVLLQAARRTLAEGDPRQAESLFQTLLTRYPQSPYFSDATDAIRGLQAQQVVDPKAVGVLVPMSGKYARFGRQTLNSIALALRIFEPSEPESPVELIIEDSGESPEQGVAALDRLYNEHHVVAVIGPILSRGSEKVAARAQELGVPLLSLAEQQPAKGGYVFHAAISPTQQAQAAAKYAVEKLGLKRFAILYPQRRVGQEYMSAFWDTVESLGGEVRAVESYSSKEEETTEVIDRLAGLYYQDARGDELSALEKARRDLKITKRTRLTEQYFRLPPIVDFDAVYIPDDAPTVAKLLRYFPFRDMSKLQFLGNAAWNSPTLIEKAEQLAEGSIFVDAYGLRNDDLLARKFQRRFEEVFGATAKGPDAIAFDAAIALEQTLIKPGKSVNRPDIRDSLARLSGFPGATGRITWVDSELQRPLRVFTVKSREIVEVKP